MFFPSGGNWVQNWFSRRGWIARRRGCSRRRFCTSDFPIHLAAIVEKLDARVLLSSAVTVDLAYSTYLGGSVNDYGSAIAVDAAGNTYVTGHTESPNFPVTPGAFDTTYPGSGSAFLTPGGGSAGFVAKFNPSGSLVWATYLGGPGPGGLGGNPQAIAVDSSGNVYVTGQTTSAAFPTTPGAFQTAFAGGEGGGAIDAFVTKLNPTGSALVYSTYLGGSNQDYGGFGIAVDASGNAYIGGSTRSSDFPTTPGAFQTIKPGFSGINSGFVTKLNATGSALVYSTYLGGTGFNFNQSVNGVAIDSSGNAYVTGVSNATDFPTTPGALQTSLPGSGNHAFVAKLNATGSGLLYSTYLGGSGVEFGTGIAVDGSGDAYVTGYTQSSDFPTTPGALQTTFGGGALDAYVSKINATGTALVYSTYLGGSGTDLPAVLGGIALDGSGNVYLTGYTSSTDFPTANPIQATYGGGPSDAFAAKLNASGTALVYSTYLGGSGADNNSDLGGIAVDGSGSGYVTGGTSSTNFPTANPFQPANRGGPPTNPAYPANVGGQNAFVAKITVEYSLTAGAFTPPVATEGAAFSNVTVFHFTDADPAGTAGDYTAVVTCGDGNSVTLTSTASADGRIVTNGGGFDVQLSHTYAEELTGASFSVTVTDHNSQASTSTSTFSVADAALSDSTPLNTLNAVEGNSTGTIVLATFTDANPAAPVTDFTPIVNWGGTLIGTPAASVQLVSRLATASTWQVVGSATYAADGVATVAVTVNDVGGSSVSTNKTRFNVTDDVRVLLLDPSGKGALTATGNGSVIVGGSGVITVASTDSAAVTVAGKGNVSASELDLVSTSGTQVSGNGVIKGEIEAGVPSAEAADPLASLAAPAAPTTTFAAVNYSGSAALTLQPGTYVGGIHISGTGTVTLSSGIYYLQGGGFSVSGMGSVVGDGVLLYNAAQSASDIDSHSDGDNNDQIGDNGGQQSDGDTIRISGQGSVVLTASTSGPYQGVVIFQDRKSTAPISIAGNGGLKLTSTLYAPGAKVNLSGNGLLAFEGAAGRLICTDLKVRGDGSLLVNASKPANGSGQNEDGVGQNENGPAQKLSTANGYIGTSDAENLIGSVFGVFNASGQFMASYRPAGDEKFIGSGSPPSGAAKPASIEGQDDSTSRLSLESRPGAAMLPDTVFELDTPTAVNGSPAQLLTAGLGKAPLVAGQIKNKAIH